MGEERRRERKSRWGEKEEVLPPHLQEALLNNQKEVERELMEKQEKEAAAAATAAEAAEGPQNSGDTPPVPGDVGLGVAAEDVKNQSEQNRGPMETGPGSHLQQEHQEQQDDGNKLFGEEQQPIRSGEEAGNTRQEPMRQEPELQDTQDHTQENQQDVTNNQISEPSQEVVQAVNQDQEESHHQEQQQQEPEQEQEDFDMDLGDLEPSFA